MSPQILSQINPKILTEIPKIQKSFSKAKPFRHVHIKNFLKEKIATSLLSALKKEKFLEKEADLFKFKQTHDLSFSKVPTLKNFNSSCLTWDFFDLISTITQTKFKGTLDMSGTLYESTSFLLPHDDELEGRKIAYILYLSKNFTKKDGGSFAIYNSKKNSPTTVAKRIPPEFNSLLLFEVSDISFHEVEENLSSKNRYAIGGWLH